MLVYGDAEREERAADKLAGIAGLLDDLAGMPPGLARHAALIGALIEAGELLQGVADAELAARGEDGPSVAQDAAIALLMALAEAAALSWRSGFASASPCDPSLLEAVRAALAENGPDRIATKLPEGFAHYALYPEAYLAAAAELPANAALQVIGIRSIGTTLAAVVAVATGSSAPSTVRPGGHPFQRRIAPAPALWRAWREDGDTGFAVVDEGPGLSGSSFGAVADVLEAAGVARERIHFLPSHSGDLGPEASPPHRERWASAHRPVAGFETVVLNAADPRHRLATWAAALVGEAVTPLRDISGGAWRTLQAFHSGAPQASPEPTTGLHGWVPGSAARPRNDSGVPPSLAHQERRKFLFETASGTWLLKFNGLGREGARKISRLRELAAAGFTPEVAGEAYGFLVQRWEPEAAPPAGGAPLAALGAYLGFRARSFRSDRPGASPAALLEMAQVNARESLGETAASALTAWAPLLPALAAAVVPVETDNRMHRHEWLAFPDRRLLKADAMDHHAAHDLVGCQDIAWDVAGAAVEFGLPEGELEELCAAIAGAAGRRVDPDLLAFCEPCYLAFQLGLHTMGAGALAGWPEEAARVRGAADAYAERLAAVLTLNAGSSGRWRPGWR